METATKTPTNKQENPSDIQADFLAKFKGRIVKVIPTNFKLGNLPSTLTLVPSLDITSGKLAYLKDPLYKYVDAEFKKDTFLPETFKIVIKREPFNLFLDEPLDFYRYVVLRNHPYFTQSTTKITGQTKFIIVDPEIEAQDAIGKYQIKAEAFATLATLEILDQRKMLRLIGKQTRGLTDSVVRASLLELVDKDPDKFIKNHNNPDKDFLIFLRELLDYNIVTYNRDQQAYYYNQTLLGTTESNAIEFFKDSQNSQLLGALQKSLYEKAEN